MNVENSKDNKPTLVLLIGPSCPYCSQLIEIVGKLLKNGSLEKAEIINVSLNPEAAVSYGVRTVPWLLVGTFEFEGAQTEEKLLYWLQQVNTDNGNSLYLQYLLSIGKLNKVINRIDSNTSQLAQLVPLAGDPDLDMNIRLGISAVFEEYAGSEKLMVIVEPLASLVDHEKPNIRADAAHYLSLVGDPVATPYLKILQADTQPQVREIANDALAQL